MKLIVGSAIIMMFASTLHAQPRSGTIALGKPSVQEAPAAQPVTVNPMTGRTLAYEQRLRSFEEAQVDAKIAEEKLRERRASAELARVDRDSRSQAAGPAHMPEARMINETGRPKGRSGPQAAKLTTEAPVAAAPPRPDPPRIAGVLRSAGELVALMEYEGKVTQVREGEIWQGKRMESITDDQVVLGGAKIAFQPQVSRFVLSDPDQRGGARPQPAMEAGPFAAPRAAPGPQFNPALNRGLEGRAVPRAIDLPQGFR